MSSSEEVENDEIFHIHTPPIASSNVHVPNINPRRWAEAIELMNEGLIGIEREESIYERIIHLFEESSGITIHGTPEENWFFLIILVGFAVFFFLLISYTLLA